jgi:hypothetical protein
MHNVHYKYWSKGLLPLIIVYMPEVFIVGNGTGGDVEM